MRRPHRRPCKSLILLAAFCVGCRFGSPPERIITLPAPDWVAPVGLPGCEIWIGDRQSLRYQTWPAVLDTRAWDSGPVPIVAFPVLDTIRLKPAGGFLYPGAEQDCALTWAEGPIALAAHSLLVAGIDLTTFNLPRLRREVSQLERPVDLDWQHLVRKMASGHFRVTDVGCRPERLVSLPLPPGLWIWDTPAREPMTALGETTTFPAPEGFHRLFGHGGRVDLLISATGAQTIFVSRGSDRFR